MEILSLVGAFASGCFIAYKITNKNNKELIILREKEKNFNQQLEEKNLLIEDLRNKNQENSNNYTIEKTNNDHLKSENDNLMKEISAVREKNESLTRENINNITSLNDYKNKYENSEKINKQLIEDKEQMELKFKEISNNILKKQEEEFNKQQKLGLGNILEPLQIEIKNFKQKIEQADKNTIETKVALDTHINNLINHTMNIGQQADNLANALRGDKKAQGNWGETRLRNLFEITGLQEGTDYEEQYCIKDLNNNDKRYILDFILKLPGNKKIIIDSKVSINNYNNYINATDKKEKEDYLKKYTQDIKNHIIELGNKEYQAVFKAFKDETQANVLDFVFMFVPLENAYMDALNYDKSLYEEAFKNKVSIVTASSLMPVIKMIQQLWNIDAVNKNIERIADKAINIYNKVEKFVKIFDNLGISIENNLNNFKEARKYLVSGNGNVIKTCDEIKEIMKNKITKSIDQKYVTEANLIENQENHEDKE